MRGLLAALSGFAVHSAVAVATVLAIEVDMGSWRSKRVRLATVLPFTAGIFLGTLITLFLVLTLRSIDEEAVFREDQLTGVVVMPSTPRSTKPQKNLKVHTAIDQTTHRIELVSYNVMVEKSELKTRGLATHKTWASGLGRRVSYYLFPPGGDEDINFAYKRRMPLITLGGSKKQDRKSHTTNSGIIQSLIDICQRDLGEYQWYVKIADTTYVRTKQLENILVTLNSSEAHFIGHGVFPEGREREELGLREGEGYCLEMGYVLSVRTLQLVCPMLEYCWENARSDNEDVEVARCVRLATGVNCTSSLEVYVYILL